MVVGVVGFCIVVTGFFLRFSDIFMVHGRFVSNLWEVCWRFYRYFGHIKFFRC